MKFTGKQWHMSSVEFGEVNVLEYKSADRFPYCPCDRCGKDIKRTMYVVQSATDQVELAYLGSDCIKHLK